MEGKHFGKRPLLKPFLGDHRGRVGRKLLVQPGPQIFGQLRPQVGQLPADPSVQADTDRILNTPGDPVRAKPAGQFAEAGNRRLPFSSCYGPLDPQSLDHPLPIDRIGQTRQLL